MCLVAVGGHGRGELAPGSDLDLLLLHRGDAAAAARVADRLWYPIWDAGLALDHAVRTPAQARALAADDLRVLLGLLDARPVAGDPALAGQLTESVLRDWRAMAPSRLPRLHELVRERRSRAGDLACLLEPDLKESYGGLREGSVLRAIAASWVADVPHSGWDGALGTLLDLRDALHLVTGRRSDVLAMQEQGAVAAVLGLDGDDAVLRAAYGAGRAIAYASEVAWHRVLRLARRPRGSSRRPGSGLGAQRVPLANGVVVQDGEVVLARDADPAADPVLALRAAAAAAQAGLALAPVAVERLARESAPMPEPWPAQARDALVSLLGSGPALVPAWEALDLAGIVDALLPEWSAVRGAPQRNALHRFTVDRHLVETAAHAGALAREVRRPDLLLVGALLHDIGKGRDPSQGDHSTIGASLAGPIAARMGFPPDDAAVIVSLVREHLLLPETATRRDLDDPATVASVRERVGDAATLGLLRALAQADSLATNATLWSPWRARLVDDLVERVGAALDGRAVPDEDPPTPAQLLALASGEPVAVLVDEDGADEAGLSVTVAADDRLGLVAAVAGVLSLHRLLVRDARIATVGSRALQSWHVQPAFGTARDALAAAPAARLADDIRRAIDGELDVAARLRAREDAARPVGRPASASPPPQAELAAVPGARSTVLEVRAHDAAGLLHRLAAAIGAAGASITGARVATLGSEAVDAFFLVDPDGAPLRPEDAERVRSAVLAALLARGDGG